MQCSSLLRLIGRPLMARSPHLYVIGLPAGYLTTLISFCVLIYHWTAERTGSLRERESSLQPLITCSPQQQKTTYYRGIIRSIYAAGILQTNYVFHWCVTECPDQWQSTAVSVHQVLLVKWLSKYSQNETKWPVCVSPSGYIAPWSGRFYSLWDTG